MKKLVCIMMMLALLVCASTAMAAGITHITSGEHAWVYTQNGGSLNVRSGPSAKETVKYRLPNHSEVIAVEESANGFVHVEFKFNGRFATGYVSLDFLTMVKPSWVDTSGAVLVNDPNVPIDKPKETVESLNFNSFKPVQDRMLVITAKPTRPGGFVNLRWVPSMEAQVITKVVQGMELVVLTEGTSWYQVMTQDGYVGFISKPYTSIVYDQPIQNPEEAVGMFMMLQRPEEVEAPAQVQPQL